MDGSQPGSQILVPLYYVLLSLSLAIRHSFPHNNFLLAFIFVYHAASMLSSNSVEADDNITSMIVLRNTALNQNTCAMSSHISLNSEGSGSASESHTGTDASKIVTRSSRVGLLEAFKWRKALNFLLVDDSAATRKALRRTLTRHGHNVAEARDGVEFLEMMQKSFHETPQTLSRSLHGGRQSGPLSHFNVVVMDHLMPRMNGSQATRAIREQGYLGLIVGLTGHTVPLDTEQFEESGVNCILTKPMRLEDLKDAIDAYDDI